LLTNSLVVGGVGLLLLGERDRGEILLPLARLGDRLSRDWFLLRGERDLEDEELPADGDLEELETEREGEREDAGEREEAFLFVCGESGFLDAFESAAFAGS